MQQSYQTPAPAVYQPDLFADPARWPRHPYCSDDLEAGVRIRSLRQAVERVYIQANPPHLRVWSIHDIDRPGAALAWERENLPPPSWAAVNRQNAHAHLVWGLSAPVLVSGLRARDAPMRYLAAIESMFREKLDADAGYAGLITKNPQHPLWRTLRGPRMAWDLAELAEYLPGIEKHRPRRRAEEVGLGRNVTLFDGVRKWAYRAIRQYWGGGLQGWNAWISATNSRALVYNGDFQHPLDGREVWHVAKSVSGHVWKKFTPEGFSQWQSAQGKKGGKAAMLARWGGNEDKRSSAVLMRARGMTYRSIAAELGVSVGIVHSWCADVQ